MTLTQSFLLYSVTAGLIWLLYQSGRREFNFYLAKTYIKKISENMEEIDKMNFLIKALDAYNKYVIKISKLQFSDTKMIYSKIIYNCNMQNWNIKDICDAFNENNKISPLRALLLIVRTPTEEFLVKRSVGGRIQSWVTLAVSVIPVMITLIQLFFPIVQQK
jgi:hypothetical protein